MFERVKTWWQQRRCSHWHMATQTWFDDGTVCRKTVCLACGKSRPCPPISDDFLMRLLDEAKAEAAKK